MDRFEENLDPEWADPIINGFINKMKDLGFNIKSKDIRYRGFSNQGDGASFDFILEKDDILNFCKIHNLIRYDKLILNLVMGKIYLKYYTSKNSFSTHYVHEKTLKTSYDFRIPDEFYEEELWLELEHMTQELYQIIEDIRLEQSKLFYKDLEDHYYSTLALMEQEHNEELELTYKWRLPTMCEFVQVIDYQVHGINGRHNGTMIDTIQGWANYWTDQPIIKIGTLEYAWVFSNIEGTSIKRIPINGRADLPIFIICVRTLPDGTIEWEENPREEPLSYLGVQSYLNQLNEI